MTNQKSKLCGGNIVHKHIHEVIDGMEKTSRWRLCSRCGANDKELGRINSYSDGLTHPIICKNQYVADNEIPSI